MALPWILKNYLRIGGGRLTGPLTLEGGESAEGVESSGSTWIRFKSGLQLCWGWTGKYSASNNTTKTISYAKAFIYQPQTYATMSEGGDGWAMFNWTAHATTTSLNIVTWVNYGPDATGYVGFNWLAIGFWK